GVRASRIASSLGARVGIAEEYRVGGTCVIRGCVPKKLFSYAAHFAEDFEDAAGFGWSVGETSFDWPTLIANKDTEIDRLNGLYLQTLGNAGVEILDGRATFIDAHTLDVAGKTVTAEKILVAPGGTPFMPEIEGIEHAISSNEAFHLEEFPKRVAVVGAGYIAVEFAGIFNSLGSDATLIYRRDKVLRGFDEDLRDRLTHEMREKGVFFRFDSGVEKITLNDDGSKRVHMDDGDHLDVDQVMYAVGRVPNTIDLGLEKAGVEMDAMGAIKVDGLSRTNVEHVFAVGDVTNRVQLTPVAIKEGHAFALTQFGSTPTSVEYDAVPSAVFSNPPIGTVGLSEHEAHVQYENVEIYQSDFRPMRNTLSGNTSRAFTKLVVDGDSGRVLGAHMIGPDAPEIIQGIGIAVRAGLTKAEFDSTMAVHPSSAEEFVLMSTMRKN
ncbi:MAG: glutathione-disulfide reductase, partial [Sphingomonadales bacterium]|nr:glutathione-disulfide reductase [Sphingomonadales bacterium]